MADRNPNERSPLQAARDYAAAGWPVFPVARGAKVPAFKSAHPAGSAEAATCRGECGQPGHGLYDATTDPALIERWWGRDPDRNVGIATGAPGPDVLDIDVKPKGSGFAALNRVKRAGLADGQQALIRTPGGGIHLYYRGTDQGNGSDRDNYIDFRGKGGYVVAPPSVTPAGGYVVVQHQLNQDTTISWREVQEVLHPEALRRQRELAGQSRNRDPQAGDEGRVGRIARFISERTEGDRNFPVFWGAKQLELSGQLDAPAVETLVDAALRSGLRGGEAEARRSIESGRRSAQRAAAQGGRNGNGQPGTARPGRDRQAPAPEPSRPAARDDADRDGGDGVHPFVPSPGDVPGREAV